MLASIHTSSACWARGSSIPDRPTRVAIVTACWSVSSHRCWAFAPDVARASCWSVTSSVAYTCCWTVIPSVCYVVCFFATNSRIWFCFLCVAGLFVIASIRYINCDCACGFSTPHTQQEWHCQAA